MEIAICKKGILGIIQEKRGDTFYGTALCDYRGRPVVNKPWQSKYPTVIANLKDLPAVARFIQAQENEG